MDEMDRKIRTLPSQPMSATHWRGEVDPSCSVVLQNGHSCRRTCMETSLLVLSVSMLCHAYVHALSLSLSLSVRVWMRHCPRQGNPTAGAFFHRPRLAVGDCCSDSWPLCLAPACTHSGAHTATRTPRHHLHQPNHTYTYTHTLHGCGP